MEKYLKKSKTADDTENLSNKFLKNPLLQKFMKNIHKKTYGSENS